MPGRVGSPAPGTLPLLARQEQAVVTDPEPWLLCLVVGHWDSTLSYQD